MRTLAPTLAAACAALGPLVPAPARAQPEPVRPGTQADPPKGQAARPPALDPKEGGRRAVRGCPIDSDCHSELEAGMRQFELEAFPRADAGSPWVEPHDPHGHSGVRHFGSGRSPLPRAIDKRSGSERSPAPTDLRPDLPWLADLELPDLPVHWDHRIIKYLEFYKSDPRGRRIMASWLRAQGRYKAMILRELREARLPRDLLYVAMIESSYDPHEYSRAGASGLWQFMPAGGRIYGLRQTRWLDERNDPVLATRAAALHLRDLYQRFGDWDLAIAAYNAGYGAILHAIAKYNTNDFWRLLDYENALPWESSLYVPKMLATAIVGHNREVFGFGDLRSEPRVAWDTVTVPKSIPLATIARAAGCDTGDIKRLNPQLRRGRTPPKQRDYPVRIPHGRAKLFAERFPQLEGAWDDYDTYVASHGERFEDIATAHDIDYHDLLELNGLDREAELRGGMILVVPEIADDRVRENQRTAADNLYASGTPRGVPGEDEYVVAVPDADLRVDGKTRVFYRVVSGDTQFGIARTFGVDRRDLASWNGLDPDAHLHPRMVLQVWVDPDFDAAAHDIKLLDPDRVNVVESGSDEHLDEAESRMGRDRIEYVADERESFRSIGRKYGLTARDLARINRMPHHTVLEPGETITVYQVIDRSESDRAEQQWRRARRSHRRSRR